MPLEVKAVIPENQVDKSKTYFDLLLNANQRQVLEIEITNVTDKDILVNVETNVATTNNHGVVDYSGDNKSKDSSLVYSFSEISDAPGEVKVPSNSVITTKIPFQMPNETYEGIIAGGIYIYEKENINKGLASNAITNKFVYSLGVQLRSNLNLTSIVPNIKVDKKKLKVIDTDYLNGIEVNVQNISPIFIKEVEIEAKITEKYDSILVYESKKSKMKLAPNSNFYFPIVWTKGEGPELKVGNYQIDIKINSAETKDQWGWTVPFKINESVNIASQKKKLVIIPSEKNLLTFILELLLLVSGFFVLTFFLFFKKKTK